MDEVDLLQDSLSHDAIGYGVNGGQFYHIRVLLTHFKQDPLIGHKLHALPIHTVLIHLDRAGRTSKEMKVGKVRDSDIEKSQFSPTAHPNVLQVFRQL